MKTNHYILTLFLVFLIIGCNSSDHETKYFKTTFIKSEQGIPYFQSDSFISNPLDIILNPIIFQNYYPGYFNKSVEIAKNVHEPRIHDTVTNFIRNNTVIQFYKASDKTLLSVFDIEDPAILMAGNIGIGISKEKFIRIFNIKTLKNDTCDIGNIEGTSKFRFFFISNKLTRIKYFGYID